MAYSSTAFQLTHLLQRVYRRLKVAKSSTATGGSATTIADTKLVNILGDANEDDYLNDWTVIVTRDAGGAGADPEGKFEVITDYDDAGTITFATMTTAIAAGDRYMYISRDFSLEDMKDVINDALVSLGNIPVVDTSITTVANQTEYTLPVALKGNEPLDIHIQGITTDSNDNRWIPVPYWRIIPAASGTAGTIILPQYPAGYTIRIIYLGLHPRVNAYDDYISEYIHPEVAVAACAAHALQWYNSQSGGSDRYWIQREDRAWNQMDIAKSTYPIAIPTRRLQGFQMYDAGITTDEFPPVPYPP